MAHHLARQGNLYCWRLTVPPELQSVVKLKELRYSLRTHSLSDARLLARDITVKVKAVFDKIKQQQVGEGSSTMNTTDIKALIDSYVKDAVESIEADKMSRSHRNGLRAEDMILRFAAEAFERREPHLERRNLDLPGPLGVQRQAFGPKQPPAAPAGAEH